MEASKLLKKELRDYKDQMKELEENLSREINQLRISLRQNEEELEYRDIKNRKETENLQKRLEAAEARNEEMTILNNEATKPLLRQIEAIREKQSQAAQDWDVLEQEFSLRITELEKEKIKAVEQNAMSLSKISELVCLK